MEAILGARMVDTKPRPHRQYHFNLQFFFQDQKRNSRREILRKGSRRMGVYQPRPLEEETRLEECMEEDLGAKQENRLGPIEEIDLG
jgi:hypothetical protein